MVTEPNKFDFLDTTRDKMAENVSKVHHLAKKVLLFIFSCSTDVF